MSGYIDLNYISKIQLDYNNSKRKEITFSTFVVQSVVILKSLKQKQEHICIELRMICFSNAIIVVQDHNLANLIKLVDRPLYDQYILERYKGGNHQMTLKVYLKGLKLIQKIS